MASVEEKRSGLLRRTPTECAWESLGDPVTAQILKQRRRLRGSIFSSLPGDARSLWDNTLSASILKCWTLFS